MQVLIKALLSVCIILAATAIGKRLPATGGLIGVMPLIGVLVLVWMYIENKGNPYVMEKFAAGALWGLLPTSLFFLVAFLCIKKQLALPGVLAAGFCAWLAAAIVHQWFLK